MTVIQFEELIALLKSIDNNLKMLISDEPEIDKCNLNDLHIELGSMSEEINQIGMTVNNIKKRIDNLDR